MVVSEHKGDWWLPDKPEIKVKGTLVISDDQAVLELAGALTEIGPGKPQDFRPEVILGISIEGHRITLLKCFQFNPTVNLGTGAKMSNFFAEMVLIGEHFNSVDELRFNVIYAEFPSLNNWVRISGFDIQRPDPTVTTVTYKRPMPIQAQVNGVRVSLVFEGLPHWEFPRQVTIRQRTCIEIKPHDAKSLDEFLKLVRDIQNFLSLAIAQETRPVKIYGETEKHKMQIKDQMVYPPIRIIVPSWFSSKGSKSPQNPLLSFKDIVNRFGLILKNWFTNADPLEPVYGGYFAVIYNPQMYLHQKFLSFLNALESYHRRRFSNYELPEVDHKKRKDAIVSAVPEHYRNWLEKKLEYSNELTLRVRLQDLVQKFSFLQFRDTDWFVNKVLNTRNYLTHYDPSKKEGAATNDELLEITHKLKVLIEAVLLTELGLSPTEVQNLVRQSDEYQLAFVRLQPSRS